MSYKSSKEILIVECEGKNCMWWETMKIQGMDISNCCINFLAFGLMHGKGETD